MRAFRLFTAPFLILAAGAALPQTPPPHTIPLQGNLSQIAGSPQPYAGLSIQLQNCPTPVSIPGYSVIVQQSMQLRADASGIINANIFPNDVITCNGTTGQSVYVMVSVVNGVPSGTRQCYQITSTQGIWNLNTQQPIACTQTPPNPQDATYNNLNVNGCLSIQGGACFSPVATPAQITYEGGDGSTSNNLYSATVMANTATFVGDTVPQASVVTSLALQPRVSSTNTAYTVAPTGILVAPRIESSSVNASMLFFGVSSNTLRAGAGDLSNGLFTAAGISTYTGHAANLPASATSTNIRGEQLYQTLQSGAATNIEGVYVNTTVGSASGPANLVLPNNYGVYIDTPTLANGATITNDYGIYVADPNATNYFAGGISVGAPGNVLKGVNTGSGTLNFGTITGNSSATQTLTMNAPFPNKGVICSPQSGLGAAGVQGIWQSFSLSANTVSVTLLNLQATAFTPAVVSWGCTVFN